MDNEKVISIFGTSKAQPGEAVFIAAENIGSALARMGYIIANGGYGGTMLASAKGAAAASGESIGITCTAFGRGGANEYITSETITSSLSERLSELIDIGDAYIILPGGTGTLMELASVWELKNKHFANADKPIIMVGAFWKPLVKLMISADPDCQQCIDVAESEEDIINILEKHFEL
jgi:uncharacterized protein (TIGR00730 family)